MSEEKPLPLPLTGAEVKAALLYKVEESLNKTCHLKDDAAYTSFESEITIKSKLNDYGRVQPDNHIVKVSLDSGLPPESDTRTVEATTNIEPAPPNQVRVETGQGVPVKVMEKGKQVVKHLKYTNRKQPKVEPVKE